MSRKHPFTSLFSQKMSRWCWLSASGRPRPAFMGHGAGEGRARSRLLSMGGHGRVADCSGGVARLPRPIKGIRRDVISPPDVIIRFSVGAAVTTHLGMPAIPVSGIVSTRTAGGRKSRRPGGNPLPQGPGALARKGRPMMATTCVP